MDVDEKWFYTMALRLLLKLPPGVATPKRYCRHKPHIPKTQFICALGRPREGNNGGKIACERVTKERPAKVNKHVGPNAGRKVGDPIIEDAGLDAAKYSGVRRDHDAEDISEDPHMYGLARIV